MCQKTQEIFIDKIDDLVECYASESEVESDAAWGRESLRRGTGFRQGPSGVTTESPLRSDVG